MSITTAPKELPKDRITTLDGFRCICILWVMLCHYFVAYTPNETGTDFYPFHERFVHIALIRYGHLGVQCFFIISGFVIFMTLEKTKNIKQFVIKRFIRLWPTLFICSIITFITLSIIPYNGLRPDIFSFLPSLTITQPYIWNRYFGINTHFLDSVEWTLVIEVSFYAISSILYFTNKKSFFNNWLIYLTVLIALHFAIQPLGKTKLNYWLELYLFPTLMVYFAAGMYLYMLYEKRALKLIHHLIVAVLVVVQLVFWQNIVEDIFILAFLGLFFLFVYKPKAISFLSNGIVTKIGLWSYSIYLIHNWVGIALINKFSVLFKTDSPVLIILPTVVIVAILVVVIEALAKALTDKIIKPILSRL
ncbi:peptidoglycan/LPS O-acetylase OafA/YrhL [Mucilaginibacter sp. UYP25]|uniref:acyltransferase family protein n=1 Tax=unclassified Mucilaginibacter TaxID=2617802 RepID=UPI0033940BE4